MSVSTSSPRSMKAYALIAFTSLPIRSVDSAISEASPRAVSDAAIHAERRTRGRTCCLRDPVKPCGINAGGCERLGHPPRFWHPELLERIEQLFLGVGGIKRRAVSCATRHARSLRAVSRRAPRPARARSRTPRTRRSSRTSTSSASARSAAARRAAAAGLFSSCASPAAIVPSEASLSRFCSPGRHPRRHRPDRPHHPAVNRTLAEHEPAEILGFDDREPNVGLRSQLAGVTGLGQDRDRADPGRRRLVQ